MKGAFIIPLLLGSIGMSFISEPVQPGALLYPVKVHVNDNIRAIVMQTGSSEGAIAQPATVDTSTEAVVVALDTTVTQSTDTEATLAAVREALLKYQATTTNE